jgi:hypothetical protein
MPEGFTFVHCLTGTRLGCADGRTLAPTPIFIGSAEHHNGSQLSVVSCPRNQYFNDLDAIIAFTYRNEAVAQSWHKTLAIGLGTGFG